MPSSSDLSKLFILDISVDSEQMTAELRLLDGHGEHRGHNRVHIAAAGHQSDWEGLLDTRRFVRRYEGNLVVEETGEKATADYLLERLGVFLGREVLGPEIMAVLAEGIESRSLLLRIPAAGSDPLAAALARVPWEIARPAAGEETLLERNLVVRALPAAEQAGEQQAWESATYLRTFAPDEGPLKVLLVFAQGPGSSPLAMRLERERLMELFHDEVMPRRKVQVDVLHHGVDRRALVEQITNAGGYHVVHWSGHDHLDLLELPEEQDKKLGYISGEGLARIFDWAGGYLPQLVVLNASHSGSIVSIKNWSELVARVQGERGAWEAEAPPELKHLLGSPSGFTGTALALLHYGVPQVLAMRYGVGDAYARRLARRFYRHLLAASQPMPVDQALALARTDLLQDRERVGQHHPLDHTAPLVFGSTRLRFDPVAGRSPQLSRRRPRPRPLLPRPNYDLEPHRGFVGRASELARLHREWLGHNGPAVALIQGLAGLGKTALAAEAIHLWHGRFDLVFAFQARSNLLGLEGLFRTLDQKLTLNSEAYLDRCKAEPHEAVYLPRDGVLGGPDRMKGMRDNLINVLQAQRVLVVVDNFETNLTGSQELGGHPCKDLAWDWLLEALARELRETGSRLLVTSRLRPSALGDRRSCLWIPLGPLPPAEAALFIQNRRALRDLFFGKDEERELGRRALRVSRGHPLILQRLGDLARDREGFLKTLERLEQEGLAAGLPDLLAADLSEEEREKERRYLEEIASTAVDLLLEQVGSEARRLLWVVTLASEPQPPEVIEGVWRGESVEQEQLRKLGQMIEQVKAMSPELRQKMGLPEIPPELLAMLEQSAGGDRGRGRPEPPPVRPLLERLHGAGLLVLAGEGEARAYGFHELVRERAVAWIEGCPGEREGLEQEQVLGAYGERYAAAFEALEKAGGEGAMDRALEAGRRALGYLARARALDRLGTLASKLVTSTRDPSLLGPVIAELRGLGDDLPPGRARWWMRTSLADALGSSGRPEEALPLFGEAAAEAEQAEHWADLGVIFQSCAYALMNTGQLDRARETFQRSAKAAIKANSPKVGILGAELEGLRIDVYQGKAEQALPAVEERLGQVRSWFQRRREGKEVPEAPDPAFLGRAMVSALDIARQANEALESWQACLDLLEETEQVERALGAGEHELARTRFNRYFPLLRLGRFDQAQRVLEGCLEAFEEVGDVVMQSSALSGLADLWSRKKDLGRAVALERRALALRDRLDDPADRAASYNNLGNYLEGAGREEEARRHQLAAMAYRIVTGHGQHLESSLRNLSIRIRRAARQGRRYDLPRLADLLADPAFAALSLFLERRGAAPQELQAAIDTHVEQVRAQV